MHYVAEWLRRAAKVRMGEKPAQVRILSYVIKLIPSFLLFVNPTMAFQFHLDKKGLSVQLYEPVMELTEEEKEKKVCRKCGETAQYFACIFGLEYLLCLKHVTTFVNRNKHLPTDYWFCKKILDKVPDTDIKYIVLQFRPEHSKWEWIVNKSNEYMIFQNQDDFEIEVNDEAAVFNVAVFPITKKELAKLFASIYKTVSEEPLGDIYFNKKYNGKPGSIPNLSKPYMLSETICRCCDKIHEKIVPMEWGYYVSDDDINSVWNSKIIKYNREESSIRRVIS